MPPSGAVARTAARAAGEVDASATARAVSVDGDLSRETTSKPAPAVGGASDGGEASQKALVTPSSCAGAGSPVARGKQAPSPSACDRLATTDAAPDGKGTGNARWAAAAGAGQQAGGGVETRGCGKGEGAADGVERDADGAGEADAWKLCKACPSERVGMSGKGSNVAVDGSRGRGAFHGGSPEARRASRGGKSEAAAVTGGGGDRDASVDAEQFGIGDPNARPATGEGEASRGAASSGAVRAGEGAKERCGTRAKAETTPDRRSGKVFELHPKATVESATCKATAAWVEEDSGRAASAPADGPRPLWARSTSGTPGEKRCEPVAAPDAGLRGPPVGSEAAATRAAVSRLCAGR